MRNVLGYTRSCTQGRCVINAAANQSTAQENNEELRKKQAVSADCVLCEEDADKEFKYGEEEEEGVQLVQNSVLRRQRHYVRPKRSKRGCWEISEN